jgi:hypothetical protein
MLIIGLALLAFAAGALWISLPRHGKVQGFVGNDFLENIVAFLITASGVIGLLLALGGLASL